MKTIIPLILIIIISICGCTNNSNSLPQVEKQNQEPKTQKLPKAMKGYELTSWQQENNWHFCLVTGTNRIKTREEIVKPEHIVENGWVKINVVGFDALKKLIITLPEKSNVFWGKLEKDNGIPERKEIEEIRTIAKKHGIELHSPLTY